MENEIEIKLASMILNKSGILANRADLIYELEKELEVIYSELDDFIDNSLVRLPAEYYEEVQTIFDLISNGSINPTLYKLQSNQERNFLRKITNNEDFYVDVQRGRGFNFTQTWHFDFNLIVNKKSLNFSFSSNFGIRDPYPYEIEVVSWFYEDDEDIIKLLIEDYSN